MADIIVNYNGKYIVDDTLYQWDKNITLRISGLTLPSTPEIHFSNSDTGKAMVRQATVTDGVISVVIPNALLQVTNLLKVYVCFYNGSVFETKYKFTLEIKQREKPEDYTIQDDEDVYSFNNLSNKIEDYNTQTNAKIQEIEDLVEETEDRLGVNLGLTGAVVGQLIRVKAVDNGSPTEWEVVTSDTTPTQYSNKPITSGGVFDALKNFNIKKGTIVNGVTYVKYGKLVIVNFNTTQPFSTFNAPFKPIETTRAVMTYVVDSVESVGLVKVLTINGNSVINFYNISGSTITANNVSGSLIYLTND